MANVSSKTMLWVPLHVFSVEIWSDLLWTLSWQSQRGQCNCSWPWFNLNEELLLGKGPPFPPVRPESPPQSRSTLATWFLVSAVIRPLIWRQLTGAQCSQMTPMWLTCWTHIHETVNAPPLCEVWSSADLWFWDQPTQLGCVHTQSNVLCVLTDVPSLELLEGVQVWPSVGETGPPFTSFLVYPATVTLASHI